jgi:hypothetical protein
MVEIRVKRAFLHKGARVEPGEVVTVDAMSASELVWQGRAELVGAEPASPGPLTTDSAPALTKGKRTKAEVTK